MWDTISLSAYSGMARNLRHSGSAPNRPQAALSPASSGKTSMYVRLGMALPRIVSAKNTGVSLWTQTARTSAITLTDYTNQFGVPVHLIQNGTSQVAFVDALGNTGLGSIKDGSTVQNPAWGPTGPVRTLRANSIGWSNGYVWTQTNVIPLLIALTDAHGNVFHVQLTSATTLIALDGGATIQGLTATRRDDTLVWSNGEVWDNFDLNALNALFQMATGYP